MTDYSVDAENIIDAMILGKFQAAHPDIYKEFGFPYEGYSLYQWNVNPDCFVLFENGPPPYNVLIVERGQRHYLSLSTKLEG